MDKTDTGTGQGTFKTYIVGFGLSLILTLVAFGAVSRNLMNRTGLLVLIFSLAIIQLIVQLVFFLHLGRESRPRWNLIVFQFMLLVLLILVFGSLWIMSNVNYHATPKDIDSYVQEEEGIYVDR